MGSVHLNFENLVRNHNFTILSNVFLCTNAFSDAIFYWERIVAYTIFDGARVWVINAKKKHLLAYTMLNGNALIIQEWAGFTLYNRTMLFEYSEGVLGPDQID